jgi:polyphosphate kinase
VFTDRDKESHPLGAATSNDEEMATKLRDETEQRLLNRELSTVEYNARLLELAADESLPLLERVKMCRFCSSNLDEFFMVRVAGLMGQAASGLSVRSADGLTPRAALDAIRHRVLELTAAQSKLWKKHLHPELAQAGIEIVSVDDLREKEVSELERRFARDVFPVLTPLAVGPGQPFPYISGLSLSLGVLARDPDTGEERFARVKVPEVLPRFIALGTGDRLVPMESAISHFLPQLFPGMEIVERAVFRVTRDADFELSDEADDLLEAVELELQRRRFGDVVRVEVGRAMSSSMLERLQTALAIDADQIYEIHGLLDLADLDQIVELDRPELKFEPATGVTAPRLARLTRPADLFDEIRRGDILVHQPYESFTTSFEAFVRAAARDPNVITLKTAVYRTSGDSPLIPALIEAAEEGKQSVCLVELKARFDESRNIEWSRKLEEAGVHVVYGYPDLKVHAKMTLVVRREPDGLRRYVHVGTGNYHAVTARLYEDVSLFTADEQIADDVASLFNHLTGFGRPTQFSKILVAPFTLRTKIAEHIRAVAQAAEAGELARIRLKVNAITDDGIVEELYAAARAGATVQICARSMCVLRPGMHSTDGKTQVRSIVGRFLEHSRLYSFEAGDSQHLYLGSADLMQRNLDRRIEVVLPVEGARQRQELVAVLDSAFADNVFSWELQANGSWRRLVPGKGERAHDHQAHLQRRAKLRARRTSRASTR